MTLRTIMVVEDSELLHRMYDLVLSRYKNRGVKIVHATDGMDALRLLPLHADTDLILLDINMPGMGGMEFLDRIKKEPKLGHIQVIIITTEGREEQTLHGLKAGARAYLTKPFEPKELHELIDRLFPHALASPETAPKRRGLEK